MITPLGSVLVVSAHAADFVWRAGGAIALYVNRGHRVRVLCLSYGERGESAKLWNQGAKLDAIKAARRAEAEQAGAALGAELRFFDAGDYPLRASDDLMSRLVNEFRDLQPNIVLTHSQEDPYNMDHPLALQLTMHARVLAQAHGYPAVGSVIGAPPVFCFEPHQPEQCHFNPNVLLDITTAFDRKRKAMECMEAQEHLWTYYTELARRRGTQAERNSDQKGITYAEAYQRIYPQVTTELC
jgi:4-oxalomesaconate hydratase